MLLISLVIVLEMWKNKNERDRKTERNVAVGEKQKCNQPCIEVGNGNSIELKWKPFSIRKRISTNEWKLKKGRTKKCFPPCCFNDFLHHKNIRDCKDQFTSNLFYFHSLLRAVHISTQGYKFNFFRSLLLPIFVFSCLPLKVLPIIQNVSSYEFIQAWYEM